MCGIVHARGRDKNNVIKELIGQYKNQRTRGTEGFGFVAIRNDGITYKRTEEEKDIEGLLNKERKHSYEVMFHHRYPTSTENIVEAAHPIHVKHKELKNVFYGVHNGVIWNDEILKETHEALGYKYTTEIETLLRAHGGQIYTTGNKFNDSEALIIELARYASGLSTSIDAKGSIAFMLLECDENDKPLFMHYGRNSSNPLTIRRVNGVEIIASEGGRMLKDNMWFTYCYKTKKTTKKKLAIGIEPTPYKTGFADTTTVKISGKKEEFEDDFDYSEFYNGEMRDDIQQNLDLIDAMRSNFIDPINFFDEALKACQELKNTSNKTQDDDAYMAYWELEEDLITEMNEYIKDLHKDDIE